MNDLALLCVLSMRILGPFPCPKCKSSSSSHNWQHSILLRLLKLLILQRNLILIKAAITLQLDSESGCMAGSGFLGAGTSVGRWSCTSRLQGAMTRRG